MSSNLIPQTPGKTPNYWCTWATQNFTGTNPDQPRDAVTFAGDQGARRGRDNLDEDVLFGLDGWATLFPEIRGDLYLVLDDGWDVPYGCAPAQDVSVFGSLIPDAVRFPSCTGTPPQRLKTLNQLARDAGWKGVGLWIAPQIQGDRWNAPLPDAQKVRDYWRERLEWCRDAEIEYWKVDWGVRGRDLDFRRMLTELGRKIAPGLLIEHSQGCQPLNGLQFSESGETSGSSRFSEGLDENYAMRLSTMLDFSDASRIYDSITPMGTSTSLDRTAFFLKERRPNTRPGHVNVEDEAYLGATLGCTIGVMRSSCWQSLLYDQIAKRVHRQTEIIRAIRWQRLAPAFGLNQGVSTQASRNILYDTWQFAPNSTWWNKVYEKTIRQGAPAVIARGLPLPRVEGLGNGDVPFVTASLNPNGALSIGALPRLTVEKGVHTPPADVDVDIDCCNRPVGLFGHFHTVSLKLDRSADQVEVRAQDLATDQSRDITAQIELGENRLRISGDTLERICQNPEGDISAPGILLLAKTR